MLMPGSAANAVRLIAGSIPSNIASAISILSRLFSFVFAFISISSLFLSDILPDNLTVHIVLSAHPHGKESLRHSSLLRMAHCSVHSHHIITSPLSFSQCDEHCLPALSPHDEYSFMHLFYNIILTDKVYKRYYAAFYNVSTTADKYAAETEL